MFKKLFVTLFLALVLAQTAHADGSERAQILEVPYARTLLVQLADSQRALLHVQQGCDTSVFEAGNEIEIAFNGSLNGYEDYVKTSYLYKCAIDRFEAVDEVLNVRKVYNSKTEAVVRDEKGRDMSIFFSPQCADIFAFRNQNVYRYGNKIVIPRGRAKCSIIYDEPLQTGSDTKAKSTKDNKVPTMVADVKVIPSNNNVYLYWKKAHDNVGVDHYIVSYSRYRLNSDRFEVSEMPNQITTTTNSLKITGLEADKTYFFYVIAVDASGNTSSKWSREIYTSTNSAIDTKPAQTYGVHAREDGRPSSIDNR